MRSRSAYVIGVRRETGAEGGWWKSLRSARWTVIERGCERAASWVLDQLKSHSVNGCEGVARNHGLKLEDLLVIRWEALDLRIDSNICPYILEPLKSLQISARLPQLIRASSPVLPRLHPG